MRVLLLSQFYPPIIGGEERHVQSLARGLRARGHEVAVGTLASDGLQEFERSDGVEVHRLRSTMHRIPGLYVDAQRMHAPPFPDPELTASLLRLVRRTRPDVVHAHNWLLHAFLPLKPFLGVPLVVTLHDYSLVCPKKSFMRGDAPCSGPALAKCLACAGAHYGALKGAATVVGARLSRGLETRLVDRFIAVSSAVARDNALSRLPHVTIPNFIPDALDSAATSECAGRLPQEPFIFFAGDLHPLKGVGVLLEAYRLLRDAPPLVLVGRRLPETPREIPEGVRVFEKWPHADVMHGWSRCLFGVAPSVLREACATVIMEAMSCGKPVVATAIGGNVDLIQPEVSGLLAPPDDAAALADAMQRLIDDPGLRDRLAQGSLERVRELRASVVAARIEDVYRDVCAGARDRQGGSEAEAFERTT